MSSIRFPQMSKEIRLTSKQQSIFPNLSPRVEPGVLSPRRSQGVFSGRERDVGREFGSIRLSTYIDTVQTHKRAPKECHQKEYFSP